MPTDPNFAPLTLSTPTGLIDVAARVSEVSVDAIVAEFDVPAAVHSQALDNGWFHLAPLARGVSARPVDDVDTVRIEAALDPRLVPGLYEVMATPAAVAEALRALGATSTLCSQASWYALAATAEAPHDAEVPAEIADAVIDGSLREGYRTMWGSGEPRGRLPLVAHLAEVLGQRFQGVQPIEMNPGFRFSLTGADATWTTTAIVGDGADWCVLYSVIDRTYDDGERDSLIERTGQVSSDLLFGSWHITDHPLQVRFRSAIELPDRTAATELLDRLVTRHLDIVDEYAHQFV